MSALDALPSVRPSGDKALRVAFAANVELRLFEPTDSEGFELLSVIAIHRVGGEIEETTEDDDAGHVVVSQMEEAAERRRIRHSLTACGGRAGMSAEPQLEKSAIWQRRSRRGGH